MSKSFTANPGPAPRPAPGASAAPPTPAPPAAIMGGDPNYMPGTYHPMFRPAPGPYPSQTHQYTRTAPLFSSVDSYYRQYEYQRRQEAAAKKAVEEKAKKEKAEADKKAAEAKLKADKEAAAKLAKEIRDRHAQAGWNTQHFFGGEETRQMFLHSGLDGHNVEVGPFKYVGEPGNGGFRIAEVRKKISTKPPTAANLLTPALAYHLLKGPPGAQQNALNQAHAHMNHPYHPGAIPWCSNMAGHPGGSLAGWTDMNPQQQRYHNQFVYGGHPAYPGFGVASPGTVPYLPQAVPAATLAPCQCGTVWPPPPCNIPGHTGNPHVLANALTGGPQIVWMSPPP